jgi:8-oxo-dGTP diphosphatase
MREQQSAQWETLPVRVSPVLPGTVPVLEWLAAEADTAAD